MEAADITAGPVFRRISRFGIVGTEPLYGGSINDILEKCAKQAECRTQPNSAATACGVVWRPARTGQGSHSRRLSGKAVGGTMELSKGKSTKPAGSRQMPR